MEKHGYTADEWNKYLYEGIGVKYYPVAGRPDFRRTFTRSEAWVLGHGSPVVKIAGQAGGVSLDHLEIDETEASLIHQLNRLAETSYDHPDYRDGGKYEVYTHCFCDPQEFPGKKRNSLNYGIVGRDLKYALAIAIESNHVHANRQRILIK